jgi:hypothetical protein
MVDAVRSLTSGAQAEALLGHPASHFVSRSLVWSAVMVLFFGTIGIAGTDAAERSAGRVAHQIGTLSDRISRKLCCRGGR